MAQFARKLLFILLAAAVSYLIFSALPIYDPISKAVRNYISFSQAVRLTTSFDGTTAPEAYDELIFNIIIFLFLLALGLIYSIFDLIFMGLKNKQKLILQYILRITIIQMLKPVAFFTISNSVAYFLPSSFGFSENEYPSLTIAIGIAITGILTTIVYFSTKLIFRKFIKKPG